ncbi:MAG: HD domain-containing protein [Rhodothermales bacterium]
MLPTDHSRGTGEALFSPLIEQAVELAALWHDGTYRKSLWRDPAFETSESHVLRVPVLAHVTAVALTVQRAGWDDETVAAAFLHDVLEDANRFGQTFRREHMKKQFGEHVTQLVQNVTERKLDPEGRYRSWRDRKEGYLAQLRNGSPEAMAISLADKLHNLWTMNEALARGIDVFSPGVNRRPLSAGPLEQRWFHQAVVGVSEAHADARLVPMRARLIREIERFERWGV